MLTPHRQTPNRRRERLERAAALARLRLGGRVICARCGATQHTMDDKCLAGASERCPGQQVHDCEMRRAMEEVGT